MRVSNPDLIAALKKHKGNMSAAADEVGLDRTTVHERCTKNPMLIKFMASLRQRLLDRAEAVNDKLIEEGDGTTARWVLDRLGKDRGYGRIGLDDDQLAKIVGALTPDGLKALAGES